VERYYSFWQRLIPDEYIDKVFSPMKDKITIDTKELFYAVFPECIRLKRLSIEDAVNLSLYFEAKTFLHGLLVVEDKLSMAHSLETRVPFLDNEIVDFAQRIPINLKLRNLNKLQRLNENFPGNKKEVYFRRTNDGKIILRKMLRKYVPEIISEAVKQGFSAPDNSWFKGESIGFVRRLLFRENAMIYNFLEKDVIKKLIDDHIEGKVNRRLLLWSLLNFEMILLTLKDW